MGLRESPKLYLSPLCSRVFTYSRSIFDYEKMKPTADELIEMLRRHKEYGNESAERLSQLMLDLAKEMEDQLKL